MRDINNLNREHDDKLKYAKKEKEIKMARKKEFYIDGYWLDTKEKFEGYKCVIGTYEEDEEDDDVFYWFDDDLDVEEFKEELSKGRNEFVITKIY